MKLEPFSLLFDQDFVANKTFYFISGNELTLIEKINARILELLQNNKNTTVTKIDSIKDYRDDVDLFENKIIYLIKSCKDLDEVALNSVRNSGNIFIFIQENSQKIKKIKNMFIKDKDCYLVDCYELDKNKKIKILNEFLKKSKVNIEKDLYWALIEKLDDRYGFFEDSLSKILELNQDEITLNNIEKLLTNNETGKEKVFFSLFKKNKDIVQIYREKVVSVSDVNDFYYNCKFFCQLIIDCNSEEEYKKKIPIYLFREKNFLTDVFRKYSLKKKKVLLRLLSSTEKLLRKQNSLSLVSGLRFILNIKKITIS